MELDVEVSIDFLRLAEDFYNIYTAIVTLIVYYKHRGQRTLPGPIRLI